MVLRVAGDFVYHRLQGFGMGLRIVYPLTGLGMIVVEPTKESQNAILGLRVGC